MKPPVAWILRVAGSVAILLLVLEVGARLILPVPKVQRIRPQEVESTLRFSENPLLGYVHKESYRNPDPDSWETFAYTNRHGQRDIEREVAKPEGTRRVVLLGDSVVVGLGLSHLDLTISRQLEQLYQQEGYAVEVLNFGVGGYSTRAEVELLRVRALKFDPDMVVLVWVFNDRHDYNELAEGRYRKSRPAIVNTLFVHSHFFRHVALSFNLFHFRQETDPDYDRTRNDLAEGEVSNVIVGFRELRELTDRHGFETLVAVWPVFTETDAIDAGSEYFETLPDGRLRVEHEAGNAGLFIRRLSPWFVADRAERTARGESLPVDLHSVDGAHPSPTGSEVAARALFELLGDPAEWSAGWAPTVEPRVVTPE